MHKLRNTERHVTADLQRFPGKIDNYEIVVCIRPGEHLEPAAAAVSGRIGDGARSEVDGRVFSGFIYLAVAVVVDTILALVDGNIQAAGQCHVINTNQCCITTRLEGEVTLG